MQLVKTKEAVGLILCHDITRIIRGVEKKVAFKKGHVVKEEDIPTLLSLGKDHLYVWEKQPGMLHENEAASILISICQGENMEKSAVHEGKIELLATCDGLFWINREVLQKVNAIPDIMIATRHSHFPVKKGETLLGTRVIPLLIEEEKMLEVKKIAENTPITRVLPFTAKKVGLVTTGNEVYYKRIEDTFTPVIKDKLAQYQIEIIKHITVPDNTDQIKDAIQSIKELDVDFILCTGGMSVDPDDLTPAAIKKAGANIETYGAPVLPGAMFLLGYFADETPIMGLPGCVMYTKATIFDLVLPSIAAGLKITKEDIVRYGEGGLCLNCKPCVFPHCGFGK
jgi:molybdenum cofactor synthesis domain-containing protein